MARTRLIACLVLVVVSGSAALVGQSSATPSTAQSASGDGAISGVVVDGLTNGPVGGAIVHLRPTDLAVPGQAFRQVTDARGRFLFRDLPPFDRYTVAASRPGYFDGHHGTSGDGVPPTPIALADGEWIRDADVALFKPSAISGRVVDQRGEPVVQAYVRVLVTVPVGGREQLVAGAVSLTDDRGAYRIAGLAAGRYLVQVPSVQHSMPSGAALDDATRRAIESSPGWPSRVGDRAVRIGNDLLIVSDYLPTLPLVDGRLMVYPPTFYTGAREVGSATPVDVGHGEHRPGVDIRLDPVSTSRLSGRVEGPAYAFASTRLRLVPRGLESLGVGSEVATALVAGDGRFTFLGVPPGAYTLLAGGRPSQFSIRTGAAERIDLPEPPGPGRAYGFSAGFSVPSGPAGLRLQGTFGTIGAPRDTWWARHAVEVGRVDRDDVVLPLRRSVTLSGRIAVVSGVGEPAEAPTTRILLEPAAGDATLGIRSEQAPRKVPSEFEVRGLLSGPYVLRVRGAHITSVTWDGRDYTNRPLDASGGSGIVDLVVTVTTASTRLAGTARDAAGQPGEPRAVIVFPTERDQWSDYGLTPERIASVVTNRDGVYAIDTLPQGDYLAAAVTLDQFEGWKDPAFLARLAPFATPVRLRWDRETTLELREVTVR